MSSLFTPDPALAALLAPTGRLRASINLGNPIRGHRVAGATVAPPAGAQRID